jgi:hypothetical protein
VCANRHFPVDSIDNWRNMYVRGVAPSLEGARTMKVLDRSCVDKEDVRHMTDAELAKLGVRLVNRQDLILQCVACMEKWSPQLDSNGKLPFDYWACPANCNR